MHLKEKYFSLIFHKIMKESNYDIFLYKKFMKFDQVLVKRTAKYVPLALVFGLYAFNDHFNHKVERGILKPIRNYGRHLG